VNKLHAENAKKQRIIKDVSLFFFYKNCVFILFNLYLIMLLAKKNKKQAVKLSNTDWAFGIGRKATDEELDALMQDKDGFIFNDLEDVDKEVRSHLNKIKNAKSKIKQPS